MWRYDPNEASFRSCQIVNNIIMTGKLPANQPIKTTNTSQQITTKEYNIFWEIVIKSYYKVRRNSSNLATNLLRSTIII